MAELDRKFDELGQDTNARIFREIKSQDRKFPDRILQDGKFLRCLTHNLDPTLKATGASGAAPIQLLKNNMGRASQT